MQAISQVVEGHILRQVLALPMPLHDMKLRITVVPITEEKPQNLSRSMLKSRLKGSRTAELSGVLKQAADMNFEELQAERRAKKYEYPH